MVLCRGWWWAGPRGGWCAACPRLCRGMAVGQGGPDSEVSWDFCMVFVTLQQDFSPCRCERGRQAFLRARGLGRGGPEREPNALGLARWACCVVQRGPPAPLGRDSPAWLTGPQAFLLSWGWRVSRGAQDPQPLLLALGALGQVQGGRGERRAPGDRKAALVPRGAAASASFRDGGVPI